MSHNNWQTLQGKTIELVELSDMEDRGERRYDLLSLTFSDGSVATIESWDFEGYASGLKIGIEKPK